MPQGPLKASVAQKSGKGVQFQLDPQGNQPVAPGHGEYYVPSLAKQMFSGGNQSGATLSAALATTYTGLCLSNPAGTTKNLIVKRVTGIIIVAPAAFLGLGLITGFAAGGITVHTAAITQINNDFIGDATASIAKLDAACTLVGTPAWNRWLAGEAATATNPQFVLDMKDVIIVPPGGYVAIGANVAGPTAGLLGSFEWQEQTI